MYKSKNTNFAFTLIEILVSITILSIIMVSVMFIFLNATDLSAKTEINRVMQENIKNVIETITEDIRKNWIKWVSKDASDMISCDFNDWSNNFKKWNKLCIKSGNEYFLMKDDLRVFNSSECNWFKENCYIAKDGIKLTNSSVSIKDLQFYITDDYVPKVTIMIVIQPSVKKWVKSNLIKANKIVIQTTISERVF